MSAVSRLAAFFVEPADHRGASASTKQAEGASPLRESRSAAGELGSAYNGPAGDGDEQGDASPHAERPRGEAVVPRIAKPDEPAVGSLDGTAVRRLAVASEAVVPPSLRLVPPLELAAEAGEELVDEASTGGGNPLADGPEPRSNPPSPTPREADVRPSEPAGPGLAQDERADRQRRNDVPGARAPRVCILGDGRSSATFARALAGRLAGAPGARCAILARLPDSPGSNGSPAATARPTARRLARALQHGGLTATARGRLVELTVSGPAAELASAVGRSEAPPIVLALPATRTTELDALLTGCDLALLVVRADTPPALTALAVAGLERTIPRSEVRAITLPTRGGGSARRAALNQAMEALR